MVLQRLPMIDTEQELFNYIKGRYLEDLIKSSDQYEYHDCTSTLYRLHIELKCRHTHYDDLLIEQEKYDALVQQAERLGFTPFYVNATPKGIYAFNLRKITVKWSVKRLPAKTEFDSQGQVDKTVALLPISEAVQL
jgi:hypothetical protein